MAARVNEGKTPRSGKRVAGKPAAGAEAPPSLLPPSVAGQSARKGSGEADAAVRREGRKMAEEAEEAEEADEDEEEDVDTEAAVALATPIAATRTGRRVVPPLPYWSHQVGSSLQLSHRSFEPSPRPSRFLAHAALWLVARSTSSSRRAAAPGARPR